MDLINLASGFHLPSHKLDLLVVDDCCGYNDTAIAGVECDSNSRIKKIKWDNFNLTGSFNTTAWDRLELFAFSAVSNNLTGPLPTMQPTLNYFYVSYNKLTGVAPLFPHGMAEIGIDNNQLYGNVSFPNSLIFLYAMNNYFNSTFKYFPLQVKEMFLSNNLFYGTIPSFPLDMLAIGLDRNLFEGFIPIFPEGLKVAHFEHNRLYGAIPQLPRTLQQLYLSYNQLIGSIPLLPLNLTELALEHNSLSGNIPVLPYKITKLFINNNNFNGSFRIETPVILHIENNNFSSIVIANTSKLIECDISNNTLAVYNQSLSKVCRLQVFEDSTVSINFIPSTTTIKIKKSASIATQTLTPTADIPTTSPNLWIIGGSIVVAIIVANAGIQSLKAKMSKPIA